MATEFKLPELGENVTAGDVVRVLVSPGDTVANEQPVLELETDKATIEVPSSVSGTVKDVKVKQGQRVNVGEVVLTVEDGGGAAEGKKGGRAKQEEPEPADKSRPQPAEAAAEGGMSQAEPGKAGQRGTAAEAGGAAKGAAERERGSAASQPDEKFAEHGGRKDSPEQDREDRPEEQTGEEPMQTEAPSEARQKPRGEVVEISRGARAAPAQQPEAAEPEGPPPPAAPSVRRLARELGVDIRRVPGSGAEGRISSEDVQAYVRSALVGGPAGAPAAPLPDFGRWGEVERRPMSNIRRKTSEHLSHAWTTIPHVTQHDKADITEIEALRKQYGPRAERAGGKLTMTAIALKIVERGIRNFPQFNASADTARNEIVYRKSIHVGVAVDTERGLLVPVIRDVDRKGIIELSAELARVSEKARAGKLSLEEMQGGGFTITNLGGIGGTSFTPIVNWPEVAILGISRAAYEPVFIDDEFEARLMLPLSLSYDHRVIDGADAARFLRWVAEAFEQPLVMAL